MKKRYPNLREQDGRYYYDHGGKPRRWEPLGRDWNKALARYHELRGGTKTEDNTVEWLTARFLASRVGLSDNTIKSYRNSAAVINKVFASCPITDLKRGHVLDFLDIYPKRQMARNAVAFLKAVCAYGVERELLPVNPLAGLALKGKVTRDRYLTDAEFLAIRERLRPVHQVAADLAYMVGLRVSGVCSLRWSHIKDGVLSFQPPKSKKPITYQLSDEVKAVLERARTLPGAVRGMTVICKRDGSPWGEMAVSRAFSYSAKAAGIPNVRFHDIRAKSASDDAATAQGRLGHTDARTTSVYLRKPQVVHPINPVRRGQM
jgi:integrase